MLWGKFCGWILRLWGWTIIGGPAPEKKCIILGAPHTSIWDFIIAYLFYRSLGEKPRVMIKKEFFIWPLSAILRAIGCIPVDRSNGAAVIKSVITAMSSTKGNFHLCMAPEGTRKPVAKWKMGYHKIAKAIDCPVYLGYYDWRTKTIGKGEKLELTDNAREDTERMQAHYESMHLLPKHPKMYITH